MPKKHWSRPTKEERVWLDAVLNPPPEPPTHRCGRCNNGTGVYNPNCPNNRRTG